MKDKDTKLLEEAYNQMALPLGDTMSQLENIGLRQGQNKLGPGGIGIKTGNGMLRVRIFWHGNMGDSIDYVNKRIEEAYPGFFDIIDKADVESELEDGSPDYSYVKSYWIKL